MAPPNSKTQHLALYAPLRNCCTFQAAQTVSHTGGGTPVGGSIYHPVDWGLLGIITPEGRDTNKPTYNWDGMRVLLRVNWAAIKWLPTKPGDCGVEFQQFEIVSHWLKIMLKHVETTENSDVSDRPRFGCQKHPGGPCFCCIWSWVLPKNGGCPSTKNGRDFMVISFVPFCWSKLLLEAG